MGMRMGMGMGVFVGETKRCGAALIGACIEFTTLSSLFRCGCMCVWKKEAGGDLKNSLPGMVRYDTI